MPAWLRCETDRLGKDALQELRIRIRFPPELVLSGKSIWLSREASEEDLNYIINTASRYSPWAASGISSGYLTAPGGHRIGLCGDVACREGVPTMIRQPDSLCIRICRDFPGISSGLSIQNGSILILGAPGWGKTTLLRDAARKIAEKDTVAVVDERGEVFPKGLQRGKRMDVLTGCPKPRGIDMVLRAMSPQWIAVDEITGAADCLAIRNAVGCGVRFIATAHASSKQDLYQRPIYRPLTQSGLFDTLCVLKPDKSFSLERMCS